MLTPLPSPPLPLPPPLFQEYYEFIQTDSSPFHKPGTFAWLGGAIALVETLIIIKFGRGLFPQPWPRTVVAVWSTVGVVAGAVFVIWSVRYYRRHGTLGTSTAADGTAAAGNAAGSGVSAAPRRRSRSVKRA